MRIAPRTEQREGAERPQTASFRQPTDVLGDLDTHGWIAYQPIVSIHSGATYGYEALLRGHETLGQASPRALVDRLLGSELAVAADGLLRRKSIEGFAGFARGSGARLFCNLDFRVIARPEFDPGETASMLRRHGISGALFCAELSERRAMVDAAAVAARLRAVIGSAQIALDDFGTGRGGLLMLHQLRPELIKLDRRFIAGVDSSQTRRVLLAAIVSLAHVLGVSVIAEAVETEAELAVCREVGCDMAQGHLIAPPSAAASMTARTYAVVGEMNRRDRRDRGDDCQTIRALLDDTPPLAVDLGLEAVMAVFAASGQRNCFPVVELDGQPIGVIEEASIKPYVYARDDVHARDAEARGRAGDAAGAPFRLADSITRCMVADIATPIDTILSGQAARGWDPCVLITVRGRYAGALSREAMLRILDQRRLRAAENQNPLTRLAGNISIADWITEFSASGEAGCLVYLDFDHFKCFNDSFGFRQGDRAILLFVDQLRTQFATGECFIGHVGGDDFFVGLRGVGLDSARARVGELLAGFAAGAASFYPAEARRRGRVSVVDRDGAAREVPLLCASAAILGVPAGVRAVTIDLLAGELAVLKRAAKRAGDKVSMVMLGDLPTAHGLAASPAQGA